jgi:hypothetical protein
MLVLLSFAEGRRMLAFILPALPEAPAMNVPRLTANDFNRVVDALCEGTSLQLSELKAAVSAAGRRAGDDVAAEPPLLEPSPALVRVFAQGAATASRKQVVPLLDRCIAATLPD